MVKGRRTRQTNPTGHLLTSSSAVDDTASPKRKDFKFDNLSHFTSNDTSAAAPMVLRGGRTKINGIAKYLTTGKPSAPIESKSSSTAHNFIDLTDDNTCDSFENVASGSGNALGGLGFSMIQSNPASNIFLQEPVLSLNFDKTPTDKSRMVIKNSFLSTEIQSKFSPPKCDPMWGSAAASVSIKIEASDYALDLSKPTQVTEIDSTTFLNQDSNSCDSGDSGVVILPTGTLESVGSADGKRRKPATPHRILCPSPVKNPLVASPSTALAHLNIQSKRTTRRNVKSKRRLHVKESENALEESEVISSVDINILTTTTTELDKKKPVLNDSVNPTAQQNTNNNQSSKQTEVPSAVTTNVGKHSGEAGTNTKLTDFFQVRRSVRKTKKEVQWERDRDIEKAIREQRESGLKIQHFEEKGRGIITTRPFMKGEFVVEYIGDLITVSEAKEREQIYAEDDNTGCYMYYFKHKNVQHCIDATAESGKLGRLVNHSRNGNLMTKTVSLNNRPHLVLIAKEDIAEGVEVTYDYGDRSKEALQHHPWLAF
ncbi:AAEL000193-PA [Aedes aegypti]|uniref:[histone H4]-lysine(20) N-methyltransferase n=2 Tax=Aedes aegypti TaxID=7159 RepID=Q17PZ6_AEDAE|nr:N-lysine methyltransferase KMT5A-B [Aedes aegypti]XP_021708975.1 N-lysine methyltransferase KMT5A-B [Aedes aegypti]XP_021708976.1 N-lysine methyltransferase KMT5A-B [Aedes aegypti]XP_021708977.1 N-lysine methyltransferase KMT5A-B [Aedes aegypti]XP_021708978.1 N-lysine methyltransferase KMT5A-B [Aedes aegypti]EAT48798.1 AAEL000193-PA [Aedes aegypti]